MADFREFDDADDIGDVDDISRIGVTQPDEEMSKNETFALNNDDPLSFITQSVAKKNKNKRNKKKSTQITVITSVKETPPKF